MKQVWAKRNELPLSEVRFARGFLVERVPPFETTRFVQRFFTVSQPTDSTENARKSPARSAVSKRRFRTERRQRNAVTLASNPL